MADDPKRRRAGGRAGHAERAGTRAIDQMPWRIPVNPDRPIEPLDAEGVAAIHNGALHILKNIGIRFLNDEGLKILARAGCKIDGDTVRMDEDFVMEMLGRAPSEFTITPRNLARALPMGGKHILFGNVSSPPNYWDLERGKVSGFMDGFRDFI
ncbi:MAG: trimethylamine methyltransferase family protein, partial [Paracoccaceae bacterium]|nr:trimethylamine methyltransferase family protein [Paracoccaceae bacterium]